MPFVLAFDLGGTSLRAGLVSAEGKVHAIAARAHRIGIEADAREWWDTLRSLVAELPAEPIAGIAITGFTRSQVLCDAAGEPVRPAQCFLDGRPMAEARDLAGIERGTWMAMTPYHPLARLAWAARQDGATFARARFVFQPKDWLAYRLTGVAACDPIANAWDYDRASGERRGGLSPT